MSHVLKASNLKKNNEVLVRLRADGYADCIVEEVLYDTISDRYKVKIRYIDMYYDRRASFKASAELVGFISVNKLQILSESKGITLARFSHGKLELVLVKVA